MCLLGAPAFINGTHLHIPSFHARPGRDYISNTLQTHTHGLVFSKGDTERERDWTRVLLGDAFDSGTVSPALIETRPKFPAALLVQNFAAKGRKMRKGR